MQKSRFKILENFETKIAIYENRPYGCHIEVNCGKYGIGI
jgi:hypothetical protein